MQTDPPTVTTVTETADPWGERPRRLDRYKRDEDITAVNIWAEGLGNGNYLIYIAYAQGGITLYNSFAKMCIRYLREHRNGIYTRMFLDHKLDTHLKEIGETTEEMSDRLVKQMEKAENMTEKMKAENQME